MSLRSINRSVASKIVEGVNALGVECGVQLDVEAIEGLLRSGHERVLLSAFVDAWRCMPRQHSGLGLRLAEQTVLEAWDLFGYLLKSSMTLGDAWVRAGRFVELLCDGVELSMLVEGDRAMVTYRGLAPELSSADVTEFVIGTVVVGARQLTGKALCAAEVRLSHDAPDDLEPYQRVFRCPVTFRRPHNTIVFPSELLHASIPTGDASLCVLLDRQAQRLLEALPRPGTLTRRVQEIISRDLQRGSPSVDKVAGELGMHARTLGRRLRAEGTSFQQLLDELRHELADRYLGEPGLSIGEVALLLGYSDPSAFNKAFRRWTGTAPHEYRRHVSSHPPPMATNDE